MLDVGLPPWRVAPSRLVFRSLLASLNGHAESKSGWLRSTSPKTCRLAVFSRSFLRPRPPACWGESARSPRYSPLRFMATPAVRLSGSGRAARRLEVRALSPGLFSWLRRPLFRGRAHSPCVCRALQTLTLMRWRPTSACSGARAARSFRLPLTPLRAPADA